MSEEEHIQKGFNAGYKMQQLDPKLAKTMQDSLSKSEHPYAQGFRSGLQEYSNEKSQERTNYKNDFFNRMSQEASSYTNENENLKEQDRSPSSDYDGLDL